MKVQRGPWPPLRSFTMEGVFHACMIPKQIQALLASNLVRLSCKQNAQFPLGETLRPMPAVKRDQSAATMPSYSLNTTLLF